MDVVRVVSHSNNRITRLQILEVGYCYFQEVCLDFNGRGFAGRAEVEGYIVGEINLRQAGDEGSQLEIDYSRVGSIKLINTGELSLDSTIVPADTC